MSEGSWNHAICQLCWRGRNPYRVPAWVKDSNTQPCCYCQWPTSAGVFIRDDPKEVHPNG